MSRLGRALHAQPPGSCIDAIDSALAQALRKLNKLGENP